VNEIAAEDYRVGYAPESGEVSFHGTLRLNGTEEYAPIIDLLDTAANSSNEKLSLNLQALDFLNSSGINMLSKFVIKMRQRGDLQIIVRGSRQIPWQGKSLKNLQRLMPSLELLFE
jgi:hypothetical protein